jgi:hypothetical protein
MFSLSSTALEGSGLVREHVWNSVTFDAALACGIFVFFTVFLSCCCHKKKKEVAEPDLEQEAKMRQVLCRDMSLDDY